MASGKWKTYDKSVLNMVSATDLLAQTTFKMILLSSASNANTLTASEVLADLTNELATANGYTNGGLALSSVTLTRSGNVVTFTSAAAVWTVSTANLVARYAAIYAVGTFNGKVNPLVGVILMDTTPQDVTTTPGNTLTITPNASGIFTVTGANVD